MGQDPDAIREEIEQTRADMSEAVEAIGYKADVPSRAKDKVSQKVEDVKSKVSETATRAKEAVTGTTSRVGDAASGTAARVGEAIPTGGEATPTGGEAKQQAKRAVGLAKENPLGLAVGAVALGFLAGLVVPSTRVENERLGPVADQVKDKVKETGQEALDRGKRVAQEAASSAADTAKRQGREHGQGLAQSAKQNAQDVGDQATQTTTRS